MGAATFTALPSAVVADTIADALQLDRRSYTSGGRGFVYVERFSSTTAPWAEPRKLFYEAGSTLATNGVNSNVVFAATGGRLVFRDCFSGQPVDATWFGASDSPFLAVTSHAQIQAAIDFVNARTNSAGNRVGGTVKIPPGIYALSATTKLRPRVVLLGEHSHYSDANYVTASVTNTTYAAGGSVQLVMLGNSNVPVFENDPTDPELFPRQSGEPQEDGSVADSMQYSMMIKGLAIYVASQTRYDCHILKLRNAWGVRVEDCYFWTRFGYAIWLKDCNAFKAINSRFIGGSFTEGARGILMWGTGDSKLVDCELGGMVGPGVWITGSSAGKDTLIGNQIFNQQRHRQQISGYDTSTDTLTLAANHWLETGMLAEWTKESGATPSTNLNQWQPYWVIKVSTNSLKLATTESNALAGVAIDLTGSIAGTNYIWSGPGASLYGSWAAENMVVTGNRFEQNQETGIYLSDAPGWEIVGNMCYYNQYDNVNGVKDSISVPNIYLRGINTGTIIQGNSLDADSVRYGPDYGIQVADSSAAFTSSRVILGPNGIRKSVVQDYVIGTNNNHAIVTGYATNESSGYSGLFLSRIETIGAKLGNTNSGADVTIPLELQTPASGVPIITARRLSFPKLGIRVTGSGAGMGNQNGFLFMSEEEGYFGANLVWSTNTSTLRLGGTGAFQNYTRDAEIAGDIGGTADLPSRKLYLKTPLGTGAGASNNAGFTFQLPAGGSSGTTNHTLYDAVRIGANGTAPTSGDTPLELLDYGAGTMSRVKVSTGAEKALYLGTEPTFGGGAGNATTNGNNTFTGTNSFTGPVSITTANIATQNVDNLVLGPSAIVPLVNGGHGGTNAAQARANLDVPQNDSDISDLASSGSSGTGAFARTTAADFGSITLGGVNRTTWPGGSGFTWDVTGSLFTSNATPATLGTYAIPYDSTVAIFADITCGGPTNRGSFTIRGCFANVLGVGATVAVTNLPVLATSGSLAASFSRSGTNVSVGITGLADESIRWDLVGRIQLTTNGLAASAGCSTTDTTWDHDTLLEGWQGTGAETTWSTFTSTTNVVFDQDHDISGSTYSTNRASDQCTHGLKVTIYDGGTESSHYWDSVSPIDLDTQAVDIQFRLFVEQAPDTTGEAFSIMNVGTSSTASSGRAAYVALANNGGNIQVRGVGNTSGTYVTISNAAWNVVRLHLDTVTTNSFLQLNGGSTNKFDRHPNDFQFLHIGAPYLLDANDGPATVIFDVMTVNTP